MLTVHIYSFSYRSMGIPPDEFGHGGGFVFDCRCLPNPGRQQEYRALSGRDDAVSSYLRGQQVVADFLKGVWDVLQLAICSHSSREFEHLSVAFGCTGGQHRSVFCAEWLQDRLRTQGQPFTIEHQSLSMRPGSPRKYGVDAPNSA
jgi:RNase adaptor protein for sRNA GlmZ degradation